MSLTSGYLYTKLAEKYSENPKRYIKVTFFALLLPNEKKWKVELVSNIKYMNIILHSDDLSFGVQRETFDPNVINKCKTSESNLDFY